jgi:hypothetical protein
MTPSVCAETHVIHSRVNWTPVLAWFEIHGCYSISGPAGSRTLEHYLEKFCFNPLYSTHVRRSAKASRNSKAKMNELGNSKQREMQAQSHL